MNPGSNSLCSLRDGNLQDIVNRGSLHDFLVSLHQEFGPVASFWFGRRPVVSLGSVQQLRQHINPNHSSMYTCLSCLSDLTEAFLILWFFFSSPQLTPLRRC